MVLRKGLGRSGLSMSDCNQQLSLCHSWQTFVVSVLKPPVVGTPAQCFLRCLFQSFHNLFINMLYFEPHLSGFFLLFFSPSIPVFCPVYHRRRHQIFFFLFSTRFLAFWLFPEMGHLAYSGQLFCVSTRIIKYFFLISILNLPSFSLKPNPFSYCYSSC